LAIPCLLETRISGHLFQDVFVGLGKRFRPDVPSAPMGRGQAPLSQHGLMALLLDNRHMAMVEDRQMPNFQPVFLIDQSSAPYASHLVRRLEFSLSKTNPGARMRLIAARRRQSRYLFEGWDFGSVAGVATDSAGILATDCWRASSFSVSVAICLESFFVSACWAASWS
jgi:hypothetical protein